MLLCSLPGRILAGRILAEIDKRMSEELKKTPTSEPSSLRQLLATILRAVKPEKRRQAGLKYAEISKIPSVVPDTKQSPFVFYNIVHCTMPCLDSRDAQLQYFVSSGYCVYLYIYIQYVALLQLCVCV